MLIPETVDVPEKGVFAPFPTAKMLIIERKSHQSEREGYIAGISLNATCTERYSMYYVCLLISLTMTSFVSGVSNYRSALVSPVSVSLVQLLLASARRG